MCYYTWDFLFTSLSQNVYYYKIVLLNPVEGEPIIFREGKIEISNYTAKTVRPDYIWPDRLQLTYII